MVAYFTPLFAQTKTNLEKFFQLIDNSILKIAQNVNGNSETYLDVNSPSSLDLLKPKAFESFTRNGFKIKNENLKNGIKIFYMLSQTSVEYGETEKDGFFGRMICERIVSLKGIVIITFNDSRVNSYEINETERDTVHVEEIKHLEDASLAFTQGTKPEIPFISNILEPVIVVATLVTSIVLLFTVRGK